MHNFPHQISDLDKLYGALKVLDSLASAGNDISDDKVLGVALAKAGVYAFRGAQTLEDALKKEQEKRRANRGTEAAARDLRRLFLLMKLIVKDTSAAQYALTFAGTALLASSAGPQRSSMWRAAMNELALDTGEDTVSHPYRLLVRLIAAHPSIKKQKLLLALEANDDSDAEFVRLSELSTKTFEQIVKKIGASKSAAANSIKILPSIAKQLGDFIERKGACFPAAVAITTEDGSVVAPPLQPPTVATKSMTAISPQNIATNPVFTDRVPVTVDLAEAIALRKKRTVEHNKAVQSLAALFHKAKFTLYEYPFDCLAIDSKSRSILAEIKTLDGSPADERQQAERALGQLKGYRFFSLPIDCKANTSVDVAAFTKKPADKTIQFLAASSVATTWEDAGEWRTLDAGGTVAPLDPMKWF